MGQTMIVDKYHGVTNPIIQLPYSGRLHANMTNDYASITLLGVSRLDSGSYTLEIKSLPYAKANISAVEISVLCKYK